MRPPGYPNDHRFMLRTLYKDEKPGICCPVIGCPNTTIYVTHNGGGLNRHMKTIDHSKCADRSKINVLDKDENLLHEIPEKFVFLD